MAAIGMFAPYCGALMASGAENFMIVPQPCPIKREGQGAHPDGAALLAANIVLYFLMKRSP